MPSSLVIRICGGLGCSTGLKKKGWSGRLDLNQRPHAPQACALPGCATSRPAVRLGAKNSVSLGFEEGQDSEKFLMQIEQKLAMRARRWLAPRRRRGHGDVGIGLGVPPALVCQMLLPA